MYRDGDDHDHESNDNDYNCMPRSHLSDSYNTHMSFLVMIYQL